MAIADAADLYLQEAEAALRSLAPQIECDLRVHGKAIEIEHIAATPMRSGWGSKALAILTRLADQHRVRLSLELANEGDGDDPDMPSEADLISFYEGFEFELQFSLTDRAMMMRAPKGPSR